MTIQHLPRHRDIVPGDDARGLATVLELPELVRTVQSARSADSGQGIFTDPMPDAADHELTLLLLVEHHVPGVGWFTRALGLNGALSVAEAVCAVLISLDWPGATTMMDSPLAPTSPSAASTPAMTDASAARIMTWSLEARRDDRLRVYSRTAGFIGTPLREALGRDGTGVIAIDGCTITVTTAGAMPRDEHTPEAVCLAGSFSSDPGPGLPTCVIPAPGDLDQKSGLPREVDLAAVNVALTGEENVNEILGGLNPELRALLLDGDLLEFTPLLQALDLGRPAQISPAVSEVLAGFPVESSRVGRAAAWSRVVALSVLTDRGTTDEVTAMLMSALGFNRADGGLGPAEGRLSTDPLSVAEIRELSQESGRLLAICGADVWEESAPGAIPLVPKCSLVDRLEMYRFLLQAR